MEFMMWPTIYEHACKKERSIKKTPVKEFYREYCDYWTETVEYMSGPNRIMTCILLNIAGFEVDWIKNQKPYYKIWPQILEKTAETSLDIPTRCFHTPFSTFAILPPKDYFKNRLGVALNNILVSYGTLDDITSLFVFTYQEDKKGNLLPTGVAINLNKDNMLDCFNEMYFKLHPKLNEESFDYKYKLEIIKLVVCASFFGIDAHEIMIPDMPRKYQDKYIRAKKEGRESDAERMLKKAKRMGLFGWKMGSEIDLPRPTINYIYLDNKTSKDDAEKRELMYRHMRSGFIRSQPWGEGKKLRKPVYIPPVMVRKDLPENPYQKGFRVGRK